MHSIELPHKPGEQVTVVVDLSKSTHEIIKQTPWPRLKPKEYWETNIWQSRLGSANSPNVGNSDTIAREAAARNGGPAQESKRHS